MTESEVGVEEAIAVAAGAGVVGMTVLAMVGFCVAVGEAGVSPGATVDLRCVAVGVGVFSGGCFGVSVLSLSSPADFVEAGFVADAIFVG
jgi:hypothetical protein